MKSQKLNFTNFIKLPKIGIAEMDDPPNLNFPLPTGLVPHHVMIKDVTEDAEDIAYYYKFVSLNYEKYIVTQEKGKTENPHYHIIGWNNIKENKFSNFKRGSSKLRSAKMSTDTKYSELKDVMDKANLTSLHVQIYYMLKEQTEDSLIYTNLDDHPICINGYEHIHQMLPTAVRKKTKFLRTNKSFLSQLLDAYPKDSVNAEHWNDDNRDERNVKYAIFNHCLEFCKHWNITSANAKSLAKKNFKDFCYTVWMQNYVYPISSDADEMFIEVWGSSL